MSFGKVELSPGVTLYLGDCLEVMPTLSEKSVDMVLADLPYGTTSCAWDSLIPLDRLWEMYRRLSKTSGAIVLTSNQPFTTALIASNMPMFKYSWVWKKTRPMGFLMANYRPLRDHEDVCVFSSGNATPKASNLMTYNPQGLDKTPTKKVRRAGMGINTDRASQLGEYESKGTNYPRTVLDIPSESRTVHPTQKPVALGEYMIQTYTNEGDLVLDNTMGVGSFGVAAVRTGRRFVGIEKDPKYFEIAVKRITEALEQLGHVA